MENYTSKWLTGCLSKNDVEKKSLVDKLLEGIPQEKRASITAKIEAEDLDVHIKHSYLSSDGKLTVLATAVVDYLNKKQDKNLEYQSIFQNFDAEDKVMKDKQISFTSKKIFGVCYIEKVRVVILPCRTPNEQKDVK